jgi:hypothetical protein
MSAEENGRVNSAYTFQVSMDNFVVMQIAEAAGDPDHLQFGEYRIRLPVS